MSPYELPTSLFLNNREFKILDNGDYRTVLACIDALNDPNLSGQERPLACLLLFFEDIDTIDDLHQLGNLQTAIEEIYRFMNCGQDEHPGVQKFKVLDWQTDAPLIASAVNKVAGLEIRVPNQYIHWWTFMGWFSAIGESTLSTVVGIRTKLREGTKLEKWERKFRQDNPHYFSWNSKTTQENELDEWVRNTLWNSK